jgi:dipeptidyl aminopeptidase/acylaminoacyl peptidase
MKQNSPITSTSVYDLVFIDDVRLSPDGASAVFVRQSIDRSANEYVRNLWQLSLNAAPNGENAFPRPLTAGRKDTSPRWAEDGYNLGFISGRGGEPAVYALPVSGGEAQLIASHPNGISGFEWSPDGKRIAFTATVHADERQTEDEPPANAVAQDDATAMPPKEAWHKKREKEQREHEDQLRFDPRIVREFPYRTGTSFLNDRWSHVYTADVPTRFDEENTTQTKPLRQSHGDVNFEAPAWTRDGQALITSLAHYPEHTLIEQWQDLVRLPVSVATAKDARRVETVQATQHSHFHPLISPDGRWVALLRVSEDEPEFRDVRLALMPVEGGALVELTAALDRGVNDFVWAKDSAHLYFTLVKDGTVNLYRVNVQTHEVEQLTDAIHEITSFDVDAAGRVVFAASTPGDPSALYVREVDGRIRLLYQPNQRFLSTHAIAQVEEIHYPSDDFNIQGWIMTPPDFDTARKYPLALEIHGGPSAMWGAGSRSMWHEWQTLVSAGYIVFFCNPRGSGGYGETFLRANRGDWGDGPMHDILRGVDLLVARGCIDAERMVMTGGSYGGYLTAWIVGRDHRFKAAVAQRGVYNLISMRGVTDIPAFNDRETGTTPWENINLIWQLSPLSLAPHVQTPLLLEHSELDYRVPISQAEELYLALRSFKKTVELIRWPREGHELSRSGEPKHREERIRRIVEWFDRYLNEKR